MIMLTEALQAGKIVLYPEFGSVPMRTNLCFLHDEANIISEPGPPWQLVPLRQVCSSLLLTDTHQ